MQIDDLSPNNSPAENGLICPHCRALNTRGTQICRSCGINLRAYEESQARLLEHERDISSVKIAQIETETQKTVAQAVAYGRRQLASQIRVLMIAGAVLAVVIVIAGLLYADHIKRRRERLATENQQALSCLARQDYVCARDGFARVILEEPQYPDAVEKLTEARFGLAQQFATAGQWQEAADELDALLQADPSQKRAIDLLRDVYDRWIKDALARGDLLTVIRIKMQRDAHFPSTTPAPPPTTSVQI